VKLLLNLFSRTICISTLFVLPLIPLPEEDPDTHNKRRSSRHRQRHRRLPRPMQRPNLTSAPPRTTAITTLWTPGISPETKRSTTSDDFSTGAHRHDWETSSSGSTTLPSPILNFSVALHPALKATRKPPTPNGKVIGESGVLCTLPDEPRIAVHQHAWKNYLMIDWDVMLQAARNALENMDFESANVPFKNANLVNISYSLRPSPRIYSYNHSRL